jgi:chromatin segregation and condensation protein Rec8/ScpA/Scc1 (kleisin family)
MPAFEGPLDLLLQLIREHKIESSTSHQASSP